MAKTPYLRDNDEERGIALLHAVGLGLALAGTASLVTLCIDKSFEHWVSALCFSLTLVFTYCMSTLYHGTTDPGKKRQWRLWDHISIYAAIAGGWTPMFLLCTNESYSWVLFSSMWIMAVGGMWYKFKSLGKNEVFSLVGYLVMGWLGFLPIIYGLTTIPIGSGWWLMSGGFFYTAGSYFYYTDFMPYFHSIWHIMVILGSLCHYIATYEFILS